MTNEELEIMAQNYEDIGSEATAEALRELVRLRAGFLPGIRLAELSARAANASGSTVQVCASDLGMLVAEVQWRRWQRIEDGLRAVGSEHEPRPDWQRGVRDAVVNDSRWQRVARWMRGVR